MTKICKNNFIFNLTHARCFDVLCIFVILLFGILIFLVFHDKIFNNDKKWSKILVITASEIFVSFLVFLFIWMVGNTSFNNCTSEYIGDFEYRFNKAINNKIYNLNKNKIIVVGDSRMELIDDDEKVIKPFNLEFIALSGTKIDWLINVAIPELKEILDKKDYTYHVIFNMGVNDISNRTDTHTEKDMANDYIKVYKNLIKEYPNVKFYFLSVNPIINDVCKKNYPGERTNKRIENFNKVIKTGIKDFDNTAYCDSYNEMEFEIPDGLHYSQNTNKKIINYIVNKCVKIKTSTK